MLKDWEFFDLVMNATREELETRIDAMSEDEMRKFLKEALQAMFQARDEQQKV